MAALSLSTKSGELQLTAALILGCSPQREEGPEKPPGDVKEASAHGVAFYYPSELTLTTETDDTGTKLKFTNGDGLPSILVQVYNVAVTPEDALEVNVRLHRELYERKGWEFKETPTGGQIARKQCNGTDILFTANEMQFHQRFLTLPVGKRTVFVMTMSKPSDDELTRHFLAPIAASMR